MNNVAFIGTEDSITVTFIESGKTYIIDKSNPNWDKVIEKLKNSDYDGLEPLLSKKKQLEEYSASSPDVEIDDGGVKYKGQYISNYLTQKMLSFSSKGLPVSPLVNFFTKLMNNPSHRSVEYLYKFLEHQKMPILANGNFLAYKAVDSNYRDYHTGKVDNSIGTQVPPMPRNMVDDDPNNGCSKGYHAGSIEYAKGFRAGGGHLIIVEINPEDCVMVPHDCNFQKLRCTTYLVVAEYENDLDDDYDARRDEEYYDDDNDDEDYDDDDEYYGDDNDDDDDDEKQKIHDRIKELSNEIESGYLSLDAVRQFVAEILDLADKLKELE